jgi:CubicO group peptidase (beta-lactamase class C family)
MRTKTITPIMIVVLLLAVAGLTPAQVPDNGRFAKARAMILDLIQNANVPSISVAVAQYGKILWLESFGWADRERLIKATPDTMYSIASTSKPITATGLMVLAERKKVDLDADVNTYLGGPRLTPVDPAWPARTVKHVLNHTAGLPLHYQFFYENEPYRRPAMEETIRRYGILLRRPGEFYFYSNLGFGIIDHIIGRISGQGYTDFMRTEVFLPLGMTHTSVGIGPGLEEYAAVRYDEKQRPIPFYTFDHDGASAVFTSARDLICFGMFQLKDHPAGAKAVLADAAIDLMQDPRATTAPQRNYGLGWVIHEDDCGYKTIVHGGGMPGVSTDLKLLPTEDLAVVMLCNTSNSKAYTIKEEIIGTLVPRYGEKYRAKMQAPPVAAARFTPPPALVGEWRGGIHTYSGVQSVGLSIRENGEIKVTMFGQLSTLLNMIEFKDDILQGACYGSIKTEDAARSPHSLRFGLHLEGATLTGLVAAMADRANAFALSSWVQLKKVADAPAR